MDVGAEGAAQDGEESGFEVAGDFGFDVGFEGTAVALVEGWKGLVGYLY